MISNFYSVSNPSSNGSLPWQVYGDDVTSALLPYAGQQIILSLNNVVFFDSRGSVSVESAAFDNVSLVATVPTAAPEPSSMALLFIPGLALLMAGKRRRRN